MERRTIVLGLFGLLQTVFGQGPEIIADIPPLARRVNETARFVCSVADQGDNEVLWKMAEAGFVISENDHLTQDFQGMYQIERTGSGGVRNYTLSIPTVREADTGKYTCMVRIPGQSVEQWPSQNTFLTVEVAPRIRRYDSTRLLVLNGGESGVLTCRVEGVPYPNVTWSRSDGDKLHGQSEVVGQLTINNATLEDSGLYRCVADNGVNPPATHVSELAVSTLPRVTSVQDRVGQIQNRRMDASLACVVEGYPSPTVEWSRMYQGDRRVITEDDKFGLDRQILSGRFLKTKKRLHTLTIRNVQANDYRDYICTAMNKMGVASAVITLFDSEDPELMSTA